MGSNLYSHFFSWVVTSQNAEKNHQLSNEAYIYKKNLVHNEFPNSAIFAFLLSLMTMQWILE